MAPGPGGLPGDALKRFTTRLCPDCDAPLDGATCVRCEVAQRLPPFGPIDLLQHLPEEPLKTVRGPMELAWVDRPEHWQRIRPHLERLCAEDSWHGMTVANLAQRIQAGILRVWVWGDFDAIFLTQIFAQASGRLACSLSWAAGADALHPDVIYPAIEAYARLNGCTSMQIMGRKGWARVMRGHGFELADQTIAKRL